MTRATNHKPERQLNVQKTKKLTIQARQKMVGLLNDGYNWIYMIALFFSIIGVIFRYMVRSFKIKANIFGHSRSFFVDFRPFLVIFYHFSQY